MKIVSFMQYYTELLSIKTMLRPVAGIFQGGSWSCSKGIIPKSLLLIVIIQTES
jgi:hypothetical protein